MARYSLFVLKVPLNTNQPTNLDNSIVKVSGVVVSACIRARGGHFEHVLQCVQSQHDCDDSDDHCDGDGDGGLFYGKMMIVVLMMMMMMVVVVVVQV